MQKPDIELTIAKLEKEVNLFNYDLRMQPSILIVKEDLLQTCRDLIAITEWSRETGSTEHAILRQYVYNIKIDDHVCIYVCNKSKDNSSLIRNERLDLKYWPEDIWCIDWNEDIGYSSVFIRQPCFAASDVNNFKRQWIKENERFSGMNYEIFTTLAPYNRLVSKYPDIPVSHLSYITHELITYIIDMIVWPDRPDPEFLR